MMRRSLEEDSMLEKLQFYIDGQWVDPVEPRTIDVINPATEEAYAVSYTHLTLPTSPKV